MISVPGAIERPSSSRFDPRDGSEDVERVKAFVQRCFFLSGTAEDKMRIICGLIEAEFDPRTVETIVQPCEINRCMWYRCAVRSDCGWQRASGAAADPANAWVYRGFHATTLEGAIGILRDRRIRTDASVDASVYHHYGIYCMLVQDVRDGGALENAQNAVMYGPKDFAHVVFESRVIGEARKLTNGGVAAEQETIREGLIAHMRQSGSGSHKNRWCAPVDLVDLVAVWFTAASFQGWRTFRLRNL